MHLVQNVVQMKLGYIAGHLLTVFLCEKLDLLLLVGDDETFDDT